jgi:PAS domain S-box-containing protein
MGPTPPTQAIGGDFLRKIGHDGAPAMADEHPTSPFVASAATVPQWDAAFLQTLLEAVPASIVLLDAEQRITYINRLRGGVTLQQVIGRPAREFVAPGDIERWQAAIDEVLRTGQPCSYLVKGSHQVTRAGLAHYEGHAVPIEAADGGRAVCIVALDVSEHVARADALQASEHKLRIAVAATGIGLWTWDVARDRVEWSERLVEIMGCEPMSPAEYLERMVHPDDRAGVREAIHDVRSGRTALAAHRIVRPDGEVRWLMPCGQLIHRDDETGQMIGGFLDVTVHRQIDTHLQKAQKLDAVGNLTAGVAHNFNNMLAIMLPALERTLSKATDQDKGMLQDALHAANRAAELVTQLMTFSGQRAPSPHQPIDLAEVVTRAVSMCRRTFERRVKIESSVASDRAPVACDPAALEQVLVNLLINARDAVNAAGRSDPRICVELAAVDMGHPAAPGGAKQRYMRLRVTDNGVGMSDAIKQRLFEPFFTTKELGKGSGLGLATSYGIVRDHGGFIAIDSEAGRGTSVEVLLLPSEQVRAIEPIVAPPQVEACPKCILVVDDEPAICRIVALMLRESGYSVHSASDGESAVALLDGGLGPDLILLDRSMPGWPVSVTLDKIRERHAAVPIIFFTGQDVPAQERALVQGVLYKPLATERLLREVESWLAK